jgi:hypothetical protein
MVEAKCFWQFVRYLLAGGRSLVSTLPEQIRFDCLVNFVADSRLQPLL